MSHQKEVKAKLKVETSPFHEYISMRKDDVVDLIDNIKTKVRNWFFSSSLHNTFQDNVLCDEQYDKNWYIDSECSCHMTGRDFRVLENVGVCEFKGYGKFTNGKFKVKRVAYVKGLKHNFISVSQLVVGTWNQVLFDEERSIISNKETKEIFLKSKRKGGMFILDIQPIVGIPSLCLLSKPSSNLSWLWHKILFRLNFKNLNKLVLNDLLRVFMF
uniref:Uncharacterized protein n=1 Tax=Lactuca sativa TaxID=4236 RepID=A0A9R1UZF8_LACSA|nr:hypothetical protein LSAT_V11C700379260 [Lactuca sativa]